MTAMTFAKRQRLFIGEVNKAGDKYRITLEPRLAVDNRGIIPTLVLIDRDAKPAPKIFVPKEVK